VTTVLRVQTTTHLTGRVGLHSLEHVNSTEA